MAASRRFTAPAAVGASVRASLVAAGLDPQVASDLENIPHTAIEVDPRRPFREPGVRRDEIMFVRSGILCKYKSDGNGRRKIVALRFEGEGILPGVRCADFGIQAIVWSEVLVGRAEHFERILDKYPELWRFIWRRIQRDERISYEWLVNCGRRDSAARVAHLLCETAARRGVADEEQGMTIPFTQQQIADITGQTSVNVNRVFADLQRQGLIARRGREIDFLDWSEMRRLASFQPNYLEA